VAVQTPTHIHFLRLGYRLLSNFSMAVLAIETSSNMRAMAVINEIWQNEYGNPGNCLVIIYVGNQLVYLGISFGHLLMAAITLGFGG
jgi:hypothetical protein